MNPFQIGFFLVCCISAHALVAQKNHPVEIITDEGRVFKGTIDYKRWGNTPQNFKIEAGGKEYAFHADKLKSVVITRSDSKADRYIATRVQINRSPFALGALDQFPQPSLVWDTLVLQVLIEGEISFYQYQEGAQTHYFVGTDSIRPLVYKRFYSTDGRTNKALENNRFRQQLLALTLDEPGLQEKIKRLSYTESAIEGVLLAYLDAKGKKPVYRYQEPRYTSRFYISTGIQATRVLFVAADFFKGGYATYPHKDHNTPALSAGWMYPLPFSNGGLWLVNEIGTHRTKTEITSPLYYSKIYGFEINSMHVRLQTMLRVYLFHKDKLYLQAGVNNGYLLNNSSIQIASNNGMPGDRTPLSMRSYEPGLAGGLGFQFRRFFVDVRYDQNYGYKPGGIKLNSSRVYVLTATVGYRLR